jgi:hypothetical protein
VDPLNILASVDSYKVKRKGHYFVATTSDDTGADLVTYVDAELGLRGLHMRVPGYLELDCRQGEKGNFCAD